MILRKTRLITIQKYSPTATPWAIPGEWAMSRTGVITPLVRQSNESGKSVDSSELPAAGESA
jgi:hypothetical protein